MNSEQDFNKHLEEEDNINKTTHTQNKKN
jgi:hypothetical protein